MDFAYINILSYIIYFVFNGLMLNFASIILNKCSKNVFILTFFAFLNVLATYLFLNASTYNSPFSFYFTLLFMLIIEFRIIARTSFRQILFCACIITFHIASVHFPLIVILAHWLNISPLAVLHNSDMRLFSIMFVCVLICLFSFVVRTLIPTKHIKRISDAKTFSWMITVFTFVLIAIITVTTILLFTDEIYIEQLVISIVTPIFYMALFYYNFKYALNFLNMTMYKRKSDDAKIIYDKVLEQKKLALEKSMKDNLTGLYNRQIGHDSLIALCKASNDFAFLFVDANALKYVNDNYGHEKGDLLLKEIANCISTTIRDIDIACRFGGDEFIVILNDVQKQDVTTIIKRINEKIKIKNDIEPFPISASIGWVYVDEELRKEGSERILKLSDENMRLAKQSFYDNGGINI